ncbi:arginine--tRNA ligase [Buchnera aphidicola (Thelaxes californica)]|uniref:Arginine--tRNA ligase n=1 Tax=Buchnera aphidicola (Thelaxes californica) TaxID=1315998 RepID=A0A4D6YAB2_9GAMM|nr:arginine--tRNA ligase [Buchnera aphidicola]QCI26727.1 arginine--tRNA ligase [Buchnera aphidicola (Thelaxes californica)]
MNIKCFISNIVKKTILKIGITDTFDPMIKIIQKKNLGHYQSNGIMHLAYIKKIEPVKFAKKIVKLIPLSCIFIKICVISPGFVNFYINQKWIEDNINKIFYKTRLGIKKLIPKTVIIDYSSPNVAKDMHIGHLRSTILGDVSARIAEFLGHKVIRANHIGDWGTQFGMIIALYEEQNPSFKKKKMKLEIIEKLYQKSKKKFEQEKKFSEKARWYVTRLHQKDPYVLRIWKKIVSTTITSHSKIYKKLNITLQKKDIKGESEYHNMIPNVIKELKNKKIATVVDGSTIILLEEYKNRQGLPMGIVIQKQDSAFLYATVDIACLKYRCQTLQAHRILYYTDSRQAQYLQQITTIGRKAGYIKSKTKIEHHMFGMVLSKDKKPFKTRDGKNIKLNQLLKTAVKKSLYLTQKKNSTLSKYQLYSISKKIGIGAVKYSDLSRNRLTDYIFDWDNMISFHGNTAPYIQYTYTRILSILKKINNNVKTIQQPIILNNHTESELSLKILQFEETIHEVFNFGLPHILCSYLYQLSVLYSSFYEKHSVLHIQNEKIKNSRLKLSYLTAKTIKKGLHLLGIQTMKKM